jgi:ABC-type transporter Mla MlaB component
VSHPTHAKRPVRRAKRAASPARPAAAPARPKAAPVAAATAVVAAAAPPAPSAGPALPAALDIREISETFEFLRSAVNCGVDSIDASRVATVDTAGVQLLLAAGRTAAAHGRALRWAGPSSSLIEAATKLGVAGLLGFARAG